MTPRRSSLSSSSRRPIAARTAHESAQRLQAARLHGMAEMARSLGHELNNTLAAMVLRLEMLGQDAPASGPVRESVDVLEAAARQGSALVARIREMARLARPLIPRPVTLAAAADDALAALGPRLAASPSVALTVDHGAPATLSGDRAELALAVRELVENALDAVRAGGDVRVETGVRGRRAWCRVVDDGEGIAAELAPTVFDPFTTTRAARARGLGLTLALTVAARHEGDLRLEARAPRGVIATLEVPIAR